jgi:hypothetical protein
MSPQLLGPVGNPPPASRNETLLREAVDRLRGELDACRKANDGLYRQAMVKELRATRDVIAELGPILQWMRPLHGRFEHADTSPCGWCRLIAAYDKITPEQTP